MPHASTHDMNRKLDLHLRQATGQRVDTGELYRLPWSKHDNPVGWLEMTDECDLHCKGCYRQRLEGHKPLELIREEVRSLKQLRNPDCIVLAGGEPLGHPQLLETCELIVGLGMKPHIATGGQRLLDASFVRELSRVKVEGVGVHIDSKQARPGWSGATEVELCALRSEIAGRVRAVGTLNCAFGVTVFKDTLDEVPMLARWTLDNRRLVSGFNFVCYRGARIVPGSEWLVNGRKVPVGRKQISYSTKEDAEAIAIKSHDVMAKIQQAIPEWQPSAFLGGTEQLHSVKWLLGVAVAARDGVIGSLGAKSMELAQTAHHLRTGRYLIYSRESFAMPWSTLLLGLVDPRVRAMWKSVWRRPRRLLSPIHGVFFAVVQPPDVLDDGNVDMCDSCPDMTIWNGRLVNSCRMDEYRRYGGLVTPLIAEPASGAP
jgi:hypothetical protein